MTLCDKACRYLAGLRGKFHFCHSWASMFFFFFFFSKHVLVIIRGILGIANRSMTVTCVVKARNSSKQYAHVEIFYTDE